METKGNSRQCIMDTISMFPRFHTFACKMMDEISPEVIEDRIKEKNIYIYFLKLAEQYASVALNLPYT